MAADLATGRGEFIDWEIPEGPRKVLFLSLEMGAQQLGHIAKPLRERYPEKERSNLIIHAKGDPLPLDQEAGQAYFLQLIDRYKPKVVFVDSLSLAAAGDLSNDSDMKRMFDFLKVARNALDFSLVIVHHHRKKANDAASKKTPNSQSDIYGSYIITASIDFALDLEEFGQDHENEELTLSWLKNRYSAPIQPFKVARSEKLHFSRNEVSFRQSLLDDGDVA
jgi:RecA-family ATPase